MSAPRLSFREINLADDAAVCVQFRADAQSCSDGNADRFFAEAGADGSAYLDALGRYMRDLPGGCVHVLLDGTIIGQIEIMRDQIDPSAAKVNLFYLTATHRGRCLGAQLEDYAINFLRGLGFRHAWLRVSAGNDRAIAFYKKHGWIENSRDLHDPDMWVMRKLIDKSPSPTAF